MKWAMAALAAGSIATPALAQTDHDTQVWTSVTATTTVAPKLDLTFETHIRSDNSFPELGQLLIRPALTYQLPRGFSATVGYLYFRNDPTAAPATQEHRTWQQIGHRVTGAKARTRLTGRTRLEQRFRVGGRGDTGWRIRQQVRFDTPLTSTTAVKAVVWNETFVGLNDTVWGARSGLDQTRTFLGIAVPLGQGLTLEPGYLNQFVVRTGPDRMNHVAAVNLFARF